jgi:hypothetical protein
MMMEVSTSIDRTITHKKMMTLYLSKLSLITMFNHHTNIIKTKTMRVRGKVGKMEWEVKTMYRLYMKITMK